MAEALKSGRTPGRITKVILADRTGGIVAATGAQTAQAPDDPFSYGGPHGLEEPPYNPDQLLKLAEQHSTHGGALEQKTMDVAATGWDWVKLRDDASDDEKEQLNAWLTGLADPMRDESTGEILLAAWLDVETLGYGSIEVARDSTGKVQKWFSMPSHTWRFNHDGVRMAQGKHTKRTWYKRWLPGDKRIIDREYGDLYDDLAKFEARPTRNRSTERPGNELLVLRKPSRRQSWYGVPGYVSAMGWIFLSLAARDDNIHFFNNRREPRWAIVLENIEDDDGQVERALKEAFSAQLDKPHRNIFIPIDGDGKIHFQKMTEDTKDISFDKLQDRAGSEILLAHRLPPDRLGAVRVGPLGGNVAMAASRVYKEGVVSTSQSLLAERVNRFIQNESGIEKPGWGWIPRELDITEESQDAQTVSALWTSNLIRLNEARLKLKMPALQPVDGEEFIGDKFFFEVAGDSAAGAAAAAAGAGAMGGGLAATNSLFSQDYAGHQQRGEKSQDGVELLRQVDETVRKALEDYEPDPTYVERPR